jgi:glycosyltransferase 2 family protein
LIVAVAVSGACLYYATRGTDWAAVGGALRTAHIGWCLAVVLVSLGCHVLRSERWRVLLRPAGDVPRMPAIMATFVGFGANAVLPLRLGEVVRPALLSRRVGIPMSTALSSIVLERILDTLLVISCFLVVGLFYEVDERLQQGAMVLAPLLAVGLGVLVVMQRQRAASERVIRRIVALLPRRIGNLVSAVADGVLRGLDGLADGRTVAIVVLYSVVLWIMIAMTYLLSFLAIDVPVPLVSGALVTMVIVAAAVFLPQAPGFLGTWQFGCVLALHKILGVPHDIAVSYSFLTWVLQMTVNIGAGAVGLAAQDVSVRDILRDSGREAASG